MNAAAVPLQSLVERVLGLHEPPANLTFAQMGARSVVVFVFGVILVRCADRRFLGRNANFDVLLSFVLGSVLSRAINGAAAFFPTLGASAVLVVLHHLLGSAACRWHCFSNAVKGRAEILVEQGEPRRDAMRRHKISEDDLDENLRINGNVGALADVAEARVERNGQISVVKKRDGRPGVFPKAGPENLSSNR